MPSSKCMCGVTLKSLVLIMSETFTQAGHRFFAATLSEMSLCAITPASCPSLFTTPAARICFSYKYCAASSTEASSRTAKISLRDPIKSETFMGSSPSECAHSDRRDSPSFGLAEGSPALARWKASRYVAYTPCTALHHFCLYPASLHLAHAEPFDAPPGNPPFPNHKLLLPPPGQ